MSPNLYDFVSSYEERLIGKGIDSKTVEKKVEELEGRYISETFLEDETELQKRSKQEQKDNEDFISVARENEILDVRKKYEKIEEEEGFEFFPQEDKDKVKDSIDAQGAFGRTKLIEAAHKGDMALIKSLIKQGADLTIFDNNGHNAMQVAEIEGYFKVAKFLSKKM